MEYTETIDQIKWVIIIVCAKRFTGVCEILIWLHWNHETWVVPRTWRGSIAHDDWCVPPLLHRVEDMYIIAAAIGVRVGARVDAPKHPQFMPVQGTAVIGPLWGLSICLKQTRLAGQTTTGILQPKVRFPTD